MIIALIKQLGECLPRSARRALSMTFIIAVILFSCIDWVTSGADPRCMKVTWGRADSKSLRTVLDKELQPDEKLLWCGYPSTEWYNSYTGTYALKMVAGIALCVLLTFAVRSAIGNEDWQKFELRDFISCVIGAVFFFVYMVSIWPDAVYAITSQRIIALRFNRVHQLAIKQLKNYSLAKHNEGSIDVVFQQKQPPCRVRFERLAAQDAEASVEPLLLKDGLIKSD
jgi:hypothetical protein